MVRAQNVCESVAGAMGDKERQGIILQVALGPSGKDFIFFPLGDWELLKSFKQRNDVIFIF